jgi:DNA topoisomerase VI subunit A
LPEFGPANRYRNILFIEKEGFDELFEALRLAERFDIAPMSTKGMSVVAARQLLDRLADRLDNVFVLQDFDISGFSILGTLTADSDRYIFENQVPIIDIGLRLKDIEAMELEAETVEVENRGSRRQTLCEHGATPEEIDFLAPYDGPCQRAELNAMTSRQLFDFVEAACGRMASRRSCRIRM